MDNGRGCRIPASRIVAIDTLAAGDVRHGAFALALSEQRGAADAAGIANGAAAIKYTRPGGRPGVPTCAEVVAFPGNAE